MAATKKNSANGVQTEKRSKIKPVSQGLKTIIALTLEWTDCIRLLPPEPNETLSYANGKSEIMAYNNDKKINNLLWVTFYVQDEWVYNRGRRSDDDNYLLPPY